MEPETESFLDFNMFGWPWTGMVTLLALAVYYMFVIRVSLARKAHNVPAPAADGPVEFLKALRIQLNTLEQLVVFLPLLWMAAFSARDELAALIGVLWPISRLVYASGYQNDDAKARAPGFILGFLVLFALFVLVAVRLIHSLLFWQDSVAAPVPVL